MLSYSLDPIVKKTSQVLNIPLDVTASVILHAFREVKRNQTQFFAAGFRFEDLGSFQIHQGKFQAAASNLISQIRKENSPAKHRETLSKLFSFRHTVRDYYDSRKFKKRFGTWH
jgi:hypothetical protein